MEKIIKKAIDGGWQPVKLKMEAQKNLLLMQKHEVREEINLDLNQKTVTAKEMIELENLWNKYVSEICVLDPLFWQALGKACGWDDPSKHTNAFETLLAISGVRWKEEAHRFHEINLTEGWEKAVKYLEDLIK